MKEISAGELESACRKCVRLGVSDVNALSRTLDRMNIEYQILSDQQADVFEKINITSLTLALAEENCEVLSIDQREESLESYYISLMGGAGHE